MALVMAQHAKTLIEQKHNTSIIQVVPFESQGDRFQGDLKKLGGKGAFVKDLEQRLLDREIDCAIHCLKDIPGDEPMHPDLELFCFLTREDPRDALIMHPSKEAPKIGDGEGLVLATSSPRRQALLKHLYPAVTIIPLRGNVDTRMRKLAEGEFDGMVLSYAGLGRLSLQNYVTHVYEPEEMLPAVGQGILVLQVRREDAARCDRLRIVNSEVTEMTALAERTMLGTLQGNCYSAIAGYCEKTPTGLSLRGLVASLDGKVLLHAASHTDGDNAADLGHAVARSLLDQGAGRVIACAA
jgi:hydroxymethylbilane synthase